ncbi:hypothetical protein EIP91_009164 [Steccherinum ochraceum]|uniref:Uncharacterized protein n=1 Tax=Steccherinum ochraceum TaxID=92696 RepID=A0A4R0R4M8_9APHY|nr:hypothetical protein EIP91_009164 [Steccherinum ochraceum]
MFQINFASNHLFLRHRDAIIRQDDTEVEKIVDEAYIYWTTKDHRFGIVKSIRLGRDFESLRKSGFFDCNQATERVLILLRFLHFPENSSWRTLADISPLYLVLRESTTHRVVTLRRRVLSLLYWFFPFDPKNFVKRLYSLRYQTDSELCEFFKQALLVTEAAREARPRAPALRLIALAYLAHERPLRLGYIPDVSKET